MKATEQRAHDSDEIRDLDAERCAECGKYGADGHTHDCELGNPGEES